MQHLDEGTIHAWLDGALSPEDARRVEEHAASCEPCSALVAEARGFIAAASRILTALDDIPAGVIPVQAADAVVPNDELASLRARKAAEALTQRRRRRFRIPIATAAAVVFVAIGTIAVLRRPRDSAVFADHTPLSTGPAMRAPAAPAVARDSAATALESPAPTALSRATPVESDERRSNASREPKAQPTPRVADDTKKERGNLAAVTLRDSAGGAGGSGRLRESADRRDAVAQIQRQQLAAPQAPAPLQSSQQAQGAQQKVAAQRPSSVADSFRSPPALTSVERGRRIDSLRAGQAVVTTESGAQSDRAARLAARDRREASAITGREARSMAALLAGCYQIRSRGPVAPGSLTLPDRIALDTSIVRAERDSLWFRARSLESPVGAPLLELSWLADSTSGAGGVVYVTVALKRGNAEAMTRLTIADAAARETAASFSAQPLRRVETSASEAAAQKIDCQR